jgi:hypothetical protein
VSCPLVRQAIDVSTPRPVVRPVCVDARSACVRRGTDADQRGQHPRPAPAQGDGLLGGVQRGRGRWIKADSDVPKLVVVGADVADVNTGLHPGLVDGCGQAGSPCDCGCGSVGAASGFAACAGAPGDGGVSTMSQDGGSWRDPSVVGWCSNAERWTSESAPVSGVLGIPSSQVSLTIPGSPVVYAVASARGVRVPAWAVDMWSFRAARTAT